LQLLGSRRQNPSKDFIKKDLGKWSSKVLSRDNPIRFTRVVKEEGRAKVYRPTRDGKTLSPQGGS